MSELWLPTAIRRPLRIDFSRDPHIVPVGAVFHVAVSEAQSLYGQFAGRTDGIESTGYIRRDGTIEQYRPVDVECDAQAAGNSWVSGGRRYGLTSWETQGMGEGDWTPEQLSSIKFIISWHHAHGYGPLRLNPGPNSPGFGYHRLFAAWNPHSHSCPGPDRVRQFNSVLVPWMSHGAHTPMEEDMPLSDADVEKIWNAKVKINRGDGKEVETSVADVLHEVEQEQDRIKAKLDQIIDIVGPGGATKS